MTPILSMKLFSMKRMVVYLLSAGLLGTTCNAFAMGLLEAYNEALQNDPVYRSAIHDNEGGQENRALGLSNLLPNVSINYSGSKNWAHTNQIGVPNSTSTPTYISSNGTLSIRQALYSPDGMARYHEGAAQANYSSAVFSGKQQELVTRLLGAYVDALLASDYLALAVAQRDTFAEQKQSNDRMFNEGEGTRTDMLETQAKLDLAEAQLIEAQDARSVNYHTLAAIVGHDINHIDGITDNFQTKPLTPSAFEDWKTLALEHNPDLQAQRYAIEISRQEVKKNRAGNLPHVDLIASLNKDKADTIDTYTTDSTVRSVGVQVTIPIYSGGAVSASTRQASAGYEKAKSDLDDKTNQVLLDLHKQHYSVVSSLAKIDALVKSVNSAKLLVTATKQSIIGGVRVNLDLLNAKQQLFTAQRDLAQARYLYLVSNLKLRSDAGLLSVADLHNIAGYFTSSQ